MKRTTMIFLTFIMVFGLVFVSRLTLQTASAETVNFDVAGGTLTFDDATGTITGYTGSPTDVVIQSTINGVSVTSIGDGAFYGCIGLRSINLPDGVACIGDSAFEVCQSLTSINLPDGVISIGDSAFSGCSSLTAITVGEGNTVYASEDGVLFNKSRTELLQYPNGKNGSYVIPDGLTSIGDDAFLGCSGLTSINIPDGVTCIGDSVFLGCSGLTSISLPDSVISIGDSAFSGCSGLTSINLSDGVTGIGVNAFTGCCSLTSISIPDGVTSIGDWAFDGCSSLTDITVAEGNTVYASEDGVLFNKSRTELLQYPNGKNGSYVIPDGVISIGDSAFRWCESLTSISLSDSVTSIGDVAFSDCFGLTSINISDGLTCIGDRAFSVCRSLTAITVTEGNTVYASEDGVLFNKSRTELLQYPNGKNGSYVIPDGVISIGDSAFGWCESLTSISLPDSVTSIKGNAFYGCIGLTSINIPDGLTCIGNWVFSNCISLMSINIPDGVISIGDGAFYGCISLTSINIPDSVTSIKGNAFYGCIGLTSINIPDSVTSIKGSAFYGCSSLSAVYFYANALEMGSNVFEGTKSDFTVYYLAGKTGFTDPWYGYATVVFDNSNINPTTTTFDKNVSALEDVTTTMTLNGNTLVSITNGAAILVQDTDYSVSENTVTIKKDYLAAQEVGTTTLTFNFSAGKSQSLIITVNDSTIDECFIATAAFGSKFEPAVVLLRHFRDQYLLTNKLGTAFVKFYYQHSPPIAAMIATRQPLKILVRVMLVPIIATVYTVYHPLFGVLFILFSWFLIYRLRQRRRHLQA